MISLTTWHIIRASGLTAYLLLFAAACLGLLLSARTVPVKWRANAMHIHKQTVFYCIAFSLLHAIVLLFDKHVAFSLTDVFIPFALAKDPSFATALGTISFYALIFVSITSIPAVMRRLGGRYWKYVHYLSWPCFAFALYHGLLRGTDSSNPYIFALYALTGLLFIISASIRIGAFFPKKKPAYESAAR